MLFNFFENLIFLEEEGVIDKRDREVLFDYWFGQLRYPQRGNLRRYFDRCGYERLAKETNSTYEHEYLGLTHELMEKLKPVIDKFELRKLDSACKIHPFKDCNPDFEDLKFIVFSIDVGKYNEVFREIDKELNYHIRNKNNSYKRICLKISPINEDVWVYIKTSTWKEKLGDCDS